MYWALAAVAVVIILVLCAFLPALRRANAPVSDEERARLISEEMERFRDDAIRRGEPPVDDTPE